jgi:hypothetical protein
MPITLPTVYALRFVKNNNLIILIVLTDTS